jgi:hypothetical protein
MSENELKWDIPVESVPLPSSGIVYPPDSVLYGRETLKIKAMTAKEEDILSSQAYIKEGTTISRLVSSCLDDNSIDTGSLLLGDRSALMISIRITGYGTNYKVKHTCGSCSSKNIVDVDLSALKIKRLKNKPVKEGCNLFEYTLPVSGKKILYKYLTAKDEEENTVKDKRRESLGIKAEASVTEFLEDIIVSIDGVSDRLKIKHFILNMPALDSRKFRLDFKDSEPGIDMKWEYSCQNCNTHHDIVLPINSEFFWPTT